MFLRLIVSPRLGAPRSKSDFSLLSYLVRTSTVRLPKVHCPERAAIMLLTVLLLKPIRRERMAFLMVNTLGMTLIELEGAVWMSSCLVLQL